ncbi:MAG: hypothetical protein B7Z62_08705 [Deltaproteobacteria bacterium 37-65-8]|nr:MAG: hypothetical protein B7Z62_08705 [Deltaproteobacteria bacterium 37-65-8]
MIMLVMNRHSYRQRLFELVRHPNKTVVNPVAAILADGVRLFDEPEPSAPMQIPADEPLQIDRLTYVQNNPTICCRFPVDFDMDDSAFPAHILEHDAVFGPKRQVDFTRNFTENPSTNLYRQNHLLAVHHPLTSKATG